MNNITAGVYEHYKGRRYRVLGIGKDTETESEVVIYQPLYQSDVAYWVRPLVMFAGTVEVDGGIVPRFKKVDEGNHER